MSKFFCIYINVAFACHSQNTKSLEKYFKIIKQRLTRSNKLKLLKSTYMISVNDFLHSVTY